jgi:hypothetical protein
MTAIKNTGKQTLIQEIAQYVARNPRRVALEFAAAAAVTVGAGALGGITPLVLATYGLARFAVHEMTQMVKCTRRPESRPFDEGFVHFILGTPPAALALALGLMQVPSIQQAYEQARIHSVECAKPEAASRPDCVQVKSSHHHLD